MHRKALHRHLEHSKRHGDDGRRSCQLCAVRAGDQHPRRLAGPADVGHARAEFQVQALRQLGRQGLVAPGQHAVPVRDLGVVARQHSARHLVQRVRTVHDALEPGVPLPHRGGQALPAGAQPAALAPVPDQKLAAHGGGR